MVAKMAAIMAQNPNFETFRIRMAFGMPSSDFEPRLYVSHELNLRHKFLISMSRNVSWHSDLFSYVHSHENIYRRFSRRVQVGGLVPVFELGVPPRYKRFHVK